MSVRDRFEAVLAALAPRVPALLRVGLAATLLGAGLDKFVAPAAWAAFVDPLTAGVLAATGTTLAFQYASGVFEVLVGVLLFADRWTSPVAAFVALSLAATLVDLAAGAALGDPHWLVWVHDLGLLALAVAVAVQAADGRGGTADGTGGE